MKRINILDSLRGIASFAVMWYHLAHASSYLETGTYLDTSGAFGKYGVQMFFVISGFILPYALYSRKYRVRDYGTFVLKRVIRLDPPYLATILGVLLLSYISSFIPGWGGHSDVDWIQIVGHLAYLNAFLGHDWLVSVFWTLAIEFQFYLLIALVFPLLAHSHQWVRYATLALLCGISVFFDHTGPTSFRPFLFQHIFLFGMGMAVFWKFVNLINWSSLVICTLLCALGTWTTLGVEETVAGILSVIIISGFSDFKAGRLLTYLGTISYSLYLVHLPIGDRFLGIMDRLSFVPQSIGLVLGCLVSIIAADLLYRIVEKPSQKWSSSISYNSFSKRLNKRNN